MLVEINWNPTREELRKFGLSMLVMFPIFGALLAWNAGSWRPFSVCLALGCVFYLSAFFLPPVGRLFYKGWMGLAFVMSAVVGPVLMAAIYYLVFTPIGIALRLGGKDSMQRRSANEKTFWRKIDPPTNPRSYERQF